MFRLGSLLVGGAIGAGIAMLMAPRAGTETQSQLRERVKGLREQYGPQIEQGRIRATELIQSGREMIDQTKTMATSARSQHTDDSQGNAQAPSSEQDRTQEGQAPH